MMFRIPGRPWRLALAAGWAVAAMLAPAGAALAQTPPPVADFFRAAILDSPLMSPDGKYIAAALAGPDGRKRLGIINLSNLKDSKVVAGFDDADIDRYRWANDERLVFSVRDDKNPDRLLWSGLWAVNRDGADFRQLILAEHQFLQGAGAAGKLSDRRLDADWHLHSVLRDGSDDVVVTATTYTNLGEPVDSKLARLDTRTGQMRPLDAGSPPHVGAWWLDARGAPAALRTDYKGRSASYLKTAQGWTLWEEGDTYGGKLMEPYWIGPNGELMVLAREDGGTDSLFQVDRRTLKLADQPTVSLEGYDFNGAPVYDHKAGRILGWRYETDAAATVWLDAGMRALQAEIDKLMPATANSIGCENCSSAPTVLVTASSDRQPQVFYLYTRASRELQLVGSTRPWIKPAQMGVRDMHRIKARDGLPIPVLVTQPPGKASGPRPAVVMVHGGPWVRGAHWAWDADTQFLASRGYVVIEPEFRGSTGYGDKHFKAGWKQWGLAMQDDVADAVQWAVKQGLVDPQRVCIAGASYGGYATLMGLVRHPELYRCGFQWVGVSDIELMYSIQWSDVSAEWKKYGMPKLVGDREKDADQLKQTSPVLQARRIKQPLLMAYGGGDRRVPVKHGIAMRDALSETGNKSVEWVEYTDEGHGWRKLETNVDFWTRVEKFLDRNIGAGAPR